VENGPFTPGNLIIALDFAMLFAAPTS
jgi:hypothetical protein